MKCPICGYENTVTLKSKTISSRNRKVNELLLKCEKCEFVFKDTVTKSKPVSYRLIISEHETSKKTFIDLCPDEELSKGNILLSDLGQAKVTSLEIKSGKRVESAIAKDILTIWAFSMEIPARIGISVNLSGKVDSYKVDLDRDFRISANDIIKIEEYILRVTIIKTLDRKMKKGAAVASVIKRVYGNPINFKNYDYDLSKNIVSKKIATSYGKKPS
jgi:uncharacterized Zn finger protein